MSALQHIGRFLTSRIGIDAQTQDCVQLAGIDILGCILAGAGENAALSAQNTAKTWGYGQYPVLGCGLGYAAPLAALCNGAAGHALEFDDWESPGNTHPSTVLFPALWAVAAERRASGAAVLDAYVAGFEVIARLGEAMNYDHYNRGWHATATLGVLGAAAGVSRLIGLSSEQSANALSLAVSQSSGLTGQGGSDAKALQAGFAAHNGVMAAYLAEQGATGQAHVLESPRGMVALTAGTNSERLCSAIRRMDGSAVREYGVVFKPYPSCGYTHRLVDCALEVRQKLEFDPALIDRIEAELPDFHAAIVPFHQPKNRHEAMFSAPFCIATALYRGRLAVADLKDGVWDDPHISSLITKTEVQTSEPKNPNLNYDPEQPDKLRVFQKDGLVIEASCQYPKGSPQEPMCADEVLQKFRNLSGCQSGVALDGLASWTKALSMSAVLALFERAQKFENIGE